MLKMKYEKYYNRIIDHIRYVMPTFHDFLLKPQILNPQWIKLLWIEREIQNKEGYSENFFFPYIALHEFEAMLLSDVNKLKEAYFEEDITALKECAQLHNNPELINNGTETAPSKRIMDCINSFDKANVGVDVLGK